MSFSVVTRPRPNAGNQTLVLSPRILGLVQPGGTCLCPEVPRQFLPGLGSLPGRLPRKPHQIPGALNLPGHRMIWGVGCLSYLRFQDSQRTPKVTPWTATRQPPLSMEFSRQEYWSGVPFPPGESSSREERNRPSWLHLKKEENSISHFQ